MIPFTGFAPDLDPTTPGVIVACDNVLPTLRGMGSVPTGVDAELGRVPLNPCRGAYVARTLSGTTRVFAATKANLYELVSSVWTDRSKAGGYTSASDVSWQFAQFGNVTLAANKSDKIQSSSIGAAFADITDAPKAGIVFTVAGAVMAFDINDARLGGDFPDAWWASNTFDHLTWTPSTSNNAAYARFLETPGGVIAGRALGAYAVAYKERSIHVGQYIGAPVQWSWQQIPGEIGAVSKDCVVDIGSAHVFIGRDDFYMFDGSRPMPIGAPIREWFFRNLDFQYRQYIKSHYDRVRAMVWWFYPSNSAGGNLDRAIIYNVKTQRWGVAYMPIEAVMQYQSPDMTFDDWPGVDATFDAIPDYPFDSPLWDSSGESMAYFDSVGSLQRLGGKAGEAHITTGDFGDDGQYSTLTEVRPRFVTQPDSSSLTHYTKDHEGSTLSLRSKTDFKWNKYDALASGRFHRISFVLSGDFEIIGYDPVLSADGSA